MTHPGTQGGRPHQGSWNSGAQPNWQGGRQWQQQPGQGWQQSGQGWQQPGAWPAQGAWQPPPKPSRPGPQKKILGIAVGTGLVALVVFVALLLFNRMSGPGYEYEDYEAPPAQSQQPDEVYIPATEEEAWELLRNNPAYAAVVPENVNCEMPIVDVASLSPEQLQDHLNELSACLMRVWERPLSDVGITIFRPQITVYTADITTACGTKPGAEPNAFYCPADQMLYYNYILSSHPATLVVGDTPMGVEAVLAHEFAHFLQGRTGVIGGLALLRYSESSDELVLEYGRRTELQADCWAGTWVGANTVATGLDQAGVNAMSMVFGSLGDGPDPAHRDHGSGEMRQQWFLTGTESTDVGICNTWTVDPELVR